MEEWKPINDFPEYEVSNLGRVKSIIKNQVIRQDKNRDGYPIVSLYSRGQRKTKGVHRLIGLAFISNPDELPEIDHINRDKTDNSVSNLRWANRSDNCINRDVKNNTGHKNISQRANSGLFRVSISRNNERIIKCFKTLEEAIVYRDSILNPLPSVKASCGRVVI
jgi:hypothetical protein